MSASSTMLWRSDDVPHVALLGSIHLLDGPLPTWAVDAHAAADLVVFEVEFSRMPSRFPEMPAGRTLSGLAKHLGREVAEETLRLGLDQEAIDRLYPLFAAWVLDARMLPEGISPHLGVESVLFPDSPSFGVLESFDDQFQAVTTSPLSEQLNALDLFLANRSDRPRQIRQAVAAWRRGDLEEVRSSLRCATLEEQYPTITANLFSKRHERWGPLVSQYIEDTASAGETLLIVVGCAHLTGPASFLADLGRCGYHFQQC